MATRSRVAVKVSYNSVTVGGREIQAGEIIHIYVHSNGYPSSRLPILTEHYNTEEKAIELISLGDVSSLHESCKKPEGHSFENKVKGHTVYYGRDRGEDNADFMLGNWEESKNDEEFGYLFEDGKWTWTCSYYKTLKELEEEDCADSIDFKDSFVEQAYGDLVARTQCPLSRI